MEEQVEGQRGGAPGDMNYRSNMFTFEKNLGLFSSPGKIKLAIRENTKKRREAKREASEGRWEHNGRPPGGRASVTDLLPASEDPFKQA